MMKRILSLTLALLMVLSVCSFTAFAEIDADVQSVADTITAEMFTQDNEPEHMVTKDLDMSLEGDITLPEGVAVSFSSSDTSAIADDGTVTRDANLKKDVTLTATITKDCSDTLTKEFNFTVLPITSEVISSDNLYYPDKKGSDLVSYATGSAVYATDNWTISNVTAAKLENDITAKLLQDSSGYYNATTTRTNLDSYADLAYLQYKVGSAPATVQTADDKAVTITVNLNPVSWGSTTTEQFYILVEGQDTGGSKNVTYLQFWRDRTRVCNAGGSKLFETQAYKVNTGENNKVEIKIDYNEKLVYLSLNGTLLNPEGTAITDTTWVRQLNNVQIGYFRGMTDSVMQVNDIAITKQTSYKVNSVNDITAEILADGQIPDFITENLKLPANSEITWTSSNTEVIANDGTVTRPTLEDAVVTMTAAGGSNTKSVQFTVKALAVSGVAMNESFIESYFDSALSGTAHSSFTQSSVATVTYGQGDGRYYLDYNTTSTSDSSKSTFKVLTSDFPVGSSGKYIFEFDACYQSTGHTMFSFLGDDSIVIRLNNTGGKLYVSNVSNEWYGSDSTAEGTAPTGSWYHFKVEINTLAETPCATIWQGDTALVTDWALIEGASFDESIGFNLRARDVASGTTHNLKLDNLVLYTESSPDSAIKDLPNATKAEYFAKLITQSAITNGNHYALENNLTLDVSLTEYDLAEMGVSVEWTSSNPSVISNSGVVTKTDKNEYVVMTAAVTAGTGDNAVTVTKSFAYTVPAADSSIYNSFSNNFDSDTTGTTPAGWTLVSNAATTVAEISGRSGKVLQADFTGSGHARKSAGSGTLTNRYFVSADVCFMPDAVTTKMYFELMGAAAVTRIGFDFQTGGISMSGDNTDRTYMVPGVEAKVGEWYHIDIDFNAAKKNVMAYINGVAITAEPLDIGDNLWAGWQYVRSVGLYAYGTGSGYLDNVTVRQSNSPAPVYDANSDYTVRSIALTNQNGKTITNATAETTSVIAKVKVIKNRTAQDGDAKVFFARYSLNGKLEQLVSAPIDTAAPGYETNGQILKLEMPLESGSNTDSFKIFVIDSDNITPISKNYNSIAPKFDTEKLFNMETNVTPALELGYDAESDYEGIDAIIYDGDTYLGKKTKHFAYIGLPEGASAENPVPAVVCVHGGGGTAFDEWVKKWNDAGYAAIAMNLNGRIPQDSITDGNLQLRHAWAGATQDNYGTVSPDDATWMYSAVTAVIGAHNVLREMPEVDSSKIGITGVSWGGVVTSTTIGVDDRFVFAIPSYGCGYLYGSETYMANAMTEDEKLWDPSMFIGKADLPILWMNGDKDGNFSLTSTTKSALLAGDNSYPCIIPNFGHNHSTTWNRQECYAFADSIVKCGTEFIRGDVTVSGSTATVKTNRAAVSATMYYTTSDTLTYLNGTSAQFSYSAVSNSASNTDTFTFEIPSDAKKFYIVFADEHSYSTSTVLYDVE